MACHRNGREIKSIPRYRVRFHTHLAVQAGSSSPGLDGFPAPCTGQL